MILEGIAGIFVSSITIVFFQLLKLVRSVNNWIIVISKFVYYSGHPLLDDDQIHKEITKRFKNVFSTLIIVILKIALLFFVIFIAIALSSLFVSMFRGENLTKFISINFLEFYFPNYLLKYSFIIGSLLPMLAIPFVKKENIKISVYSPIDEFLHYTFLGNKNIATFLFKFELWINRKKLKASVPNQNVYISGMARAGTTALMQILGQMDQFKSLSYRNLPFLFMPKTWLKIAGKRKDFEVERSHQDGINHSLNSFEALEEAFWRNYVGAKYIKEKSIINHTIDSKVFIKYNAFRKLVAGNEIYLSKNNNHLLRAESIHYFDGKMGNNTKTIIPFRNPYDQANSLMRQHKLLSDLQKEDDFVLDYMDFLVHHEFGLNHKVSMFDSEMDLTQISENLDSLDYWLEVWYLFYKEVYLKFSKIENFHFFCYENFVQHPRSSVRDLLSRLELDENMIDSVPIKKFKPKRQKAIEGINKKYMELYNNLILISLNNYDG